MRRYLNWAVLCVPLFAAAPLAAATDDEDPDWPCIQRMVPEISAGMVWAGPPIDDVGDAWRADQEIARLAGNLSRRRMTMDEAKAAIGAFADGGGGGRNEKLAILFAGVLANINSERTTIMNGIRRYTRRQRALAEQIETRGTALANLTDDGTEESKTRRADLTEEQLWDTRIYEEREQSLTYVCETPVILEQRAFALGREVMSHLD